MIVTRKRPEREMKAGALSRTCRSYTRRCLAPAHGLVKSPALSSLHGQCVPDALCLTTETSISGAIVDCSLLRRLSTHFGMNQGTDVSLR